MNGVGPATVPLSAKARAFTFPATTSKLVILKDDEDVDEIVGSVAALRDAALRASIAAAMADSDRESHIKADVTTDNQTSDDEDGPQGKEPVTDTTLDATVTLERPPSSETPSITLLLDTSVHSATGEHGPIFLSPTETENAAPLSAVPPQEENDTVEESREKVPAVAYHTDSGSEDSDESDSDDEQPAVVNTSRRNTGNSKAESPAETSPLPSPFPQASEAEKAKGSARLGHRRHASREGGRILPVRKPSAVPQRSPSSQSRESRSHSPRPVYPRRTALGLSARYPETVDQNKRAPILNRSTVSSPVDNKLPSGASVTPVPGGKLSPVQLVFQLRDTLALEPTFYYTLKGLLVEYEERTNRRMAIVYPTNVEVPTAAFQHPHTTAAPPNPETGKSSQASRLWETLSDEGNFVSTHEDSDLSDLEDYEKQRLASKADRRAHRNGSSSPQFKQGAPAQSLRAPTVTQVHTDSEIGSRGEPLSF